MLIGAIEAGGTKFVLGIGNENGEILERLSIPTELPEITMPKVIKFFKEKKIYNLIKEKERYGMFIYSYT